MYIRKWRQMIMPYLAYFLYSESALVHSLVAANISTIKQKRGKDFWQQNGLGALVFSVREDSYIASESETLMNMTSHDRTVTLTFCQDRQIMLDCWWSQVCWTQQVRTKVGCHWPRRSCWHAVGSRLAGFSTDCCIDIHPLLSPCGEIHCVECRDEGVAAHQDLLLPDP